LIEQVRQQARAAGGMAVAVIFDPHPPRVLRPDKAPPLLMTLDQKLEALERAGIDGVVIVRFTHEMSRWEPEYFVESVLLDWLRVAEVWVGANFVFGRDRMGTFTLLRALGEDRGFRVEKIDPVFYRDFVVSSTRVRRLIAEGRVDEAGALLGHPYFIDGAVVRGDGRGRELGIPTANLETPNDLLPAEGVYATLALLDGVRHPSVTSVGVRPTIGDGKFTVEAHLLDWPSATDLYGRQIRLSFVQRLREQRRYTDMDALKAQMTADCAEAAEVLARLAPR
jgi:riboflavin kinase/FMN adenylyltransferase